MTNRRQMVDIFKNKYKNIKYIELLKKNLKTLIYE